MVQVETFGSSSKGNCYLLSEGSSSLMLEAGINPSKLKVNWRQVQGVVLTHEHSDHAKYLEQTLKRAGAKVIASLGTLVALGTPLYKAKAISNGETIQVGDWQITAFDVEHDAREPLGYIIKSPSNKVILFATDTYYIRYRFSKVNIALVECNYDLERLEQGYQFGRIDRKQHDRILKSHFALDNVVKFFAANKSWPGELEEVHLLHLSDRNSDAEYFREVITKVTGVPVYIAGEEA